MRIGLFQPDIPQNVGSIIRLAACMDLVVGIIEPCGFVFNSAKLRRAGMDYLTAASLQRFQSFDRFQADRAPGRLVLLTTGATQSYTDHTFAADDWLLFGQESAGVPETVHSVADVRLRIPMRPGMRSLNVAQSVAMVVGEAMRQTGGFGALEGAASGERSEPGHSP